MPNLKDALGKTHASSCCAFASVAFPACAWSSATSPPAGMLGVLAQVFPRGHVPALHGPLLQERSGEGTEAQAKAARGSAPGHTRAGGHEDLCARKAREAREAVESLRISKLADAASVVEEGSMEMLTYARFPMEHRRRIRTNNGIERLNREIKAVASFPDGKSVAMLAAARCKFIAEGNWGSRRYLDVSLLDGWDERGHEG